ncbi:MAG: glycosyltransferase [Candidatus Woykebacteria bacterium]
MRVVFFTDTYWPQINGVAENIETTKAQLERKGHEVLVVAPKVPGYQDKDQNILRLPAVKFIKNPEQRFIVPIPEKSLRALFREKIDIIHVQTQGSAGFLGWEIAQLKGVPCVITYQTLLNRYTHYFLNGTLFRPKMAEVGSRIFCNLGEIVVVPTERVKKELESWGVTKEISVVPGGVELERFKSQSKGFLRTKLKLDKNQKIILYLGRLGKEKSVDFIIESLTKLLKEEESVYLVIVGDGPERDHLENLVKRLNLSKKVLFTGFIERKDVPKVYGDSDIFVFASKTETQGLTVPEAMLAELPVVVVEDPAFEGVVVDRKTGLSAKFNKKDFANKVRALLEDEEFRKKLGKKGKEFAENKFSAQVQAGRLVEVYKKAILLHAGKRTVTRILRSRFNLVADFLKVNEVFTKFKEIVRWYRL